MAVSHRVRFALVVSSVLVLSHSVLADDRFTVGRVYIVGNTETNKNVILYLVAIQGGDRVSRTDLHQAEMRLRRVRLFRTPTVTVLRRSDDEKAEGFPLDLLVAIEEKKWNWLLFASYDIVVGRLTLDFERMNGGALRIRDHIRASLPK